MTRGEIVQDRLEVSDCLEPGTKKITVTGRATLDAIVASCGILSMEAMSCPSPTVWTFFFQDLQLSKRPDFHVIMAVAVKLNRQTYDMVYGKMEKKQSQLVDLLAQF